MSTNYTTYGDISPRIGAKAVAKLLKRGQYQMVTERFGQVDPQEKKKGKTRKYRRYLSFPRATAPLAEGIPPKGQKLRYTDVNINLEQYGDLAEITDHVEDTHEDPVLAEARDLCSEQIAETKEVLRIGYLKAGTNVFYANGETARSDVASPPLRSDFRKIFRYLANHKAKRFTKLVAASAMISTHAVEPAYWVMGHTDLLADLRDMPNFLPVSEYGNAMKAIPGEVGSMEEFRFVLTPLFEPWESSGASSTTYLAGGVEVSSAASCDVYPMIVVAMNSYAIVPLQGYGAVNINVQNPGKVTKSDPLGQVGFVSWKTWDGGGILNQAWVARYEVAATAKPA
jgi:N4-gp56 family major capsid protein